MSNDPFGRKITEMLEPHWKNHPGQRDAVHGAYHAGAGCFWGAAGAVEGAFNFVQGKGFTTDKFDKAGKDFQRCHDHWVKGENRNDRENYNPSPGKG